MFLGPNGEVEEYSVVSIQQNTAISSDLILDQKEEHLFIMTQNMVHTKTHSHCNPASTFVSSVGIKIRQIKYCHVSAPVVSYGCRLF